jgi:ribonuclease HII
MKRVKYLIGIDEVGRGPLAGPLAVCACVIPVSNKLKLFKGIKDSKKCTEEKRESWLKLIKDEKKKGNLNFAVSYSSEKMIDEKGITFAINSALQKSLQKLKLNPNDCEVFLDGGLKAPIEYKKQKTIIKGDEKIPVISLASIAAKVARDNLMKKIAKRYPHYGFENHKGYGTKFHIEMIRTYGISTAHRKLFLRKFSARLTKVTR